jgi:hypothetical protein
MVAPITSELGVCLSSMHIRGQTMAITEKAFWYEGIKEGEKRERERILKLIKDTYVDLDKEEIGSFVWTEEIIELIEKEA